MKKFICPISGLLLFSSDLGVAQGKEVSVERNMAVELVKYPSWGECLRAVANFYLAFQNGLNVGGVCLWENGETGVRAQIGKRASVRNCFPNPENKKELNSSPHNNFL